MNIDFIKKVSKELNIEKYDTESSKEFCFRVVYTMLGFWIKTTVCATNINDIQFSSAVNKAYVHRRVSQVLNSIIKINPELKEFFPDDVDTVQYIRATLLRASELSEIGFSTELFNVEQRDIIIGDSRARVGLVSPEKYGYATGLSWHVSKDTSDSIANIVDVFNLPRETYEELFNRYLSYAVWTSIEAYDEFEVFNSESSHVFSSSWKVAPELEDGEIVIGRKKPVKASYDYYFIKGSKDGYRHYKLPEYAKDENVKDIQRLLYAIKAISGNNAICSVNRYKKYSVFNCWSQLPPAEDYLLRYIGWPVDGIYNQRNGFAIINDYVEFVTKILEQLGLKLEVKDCE